MTAAAATRVIEAGGLQALRGALRGYGKAVARTYQDETEVAKLLAHYKLTGTALLPACALCFCLRPSRWRAMDRSDEVICEPAWKSGNERGLNPMLLRPPATGQPPKQTY